MNIKGKEDTYLIYDSIHNAQDISVTAREILYTFAKENKMFLTPMAVFLSTSY